MIKTKKLRVGTIIAVFILMSSSFIAFATEVYVRHTAYNVVFVMDTSGSLEITSNGKPPTDPYKLRVDALHQILKWLQGTNSNAGLVTFDTTAESFERTFRLCDKDFETNVFPNYIRDKKLGSWTDISLALEAGIEFFNVNRGMNPNIPNLLVLFTDGVLDLGSEEKDVTASKKMEQLASKAKNDGILIAVIALNDDGNSDPDKLNLLKNVASEDLFYEVKSASGLWEKFDGLHSKLFQSYKKTLNADGEDTFVVPYFGEPVLTFTFLANSNEDDFELRSPDGRIFNKNNIEQMGSVEYMGYTTIITVKKPVWGTWVSNIQARDATVNTSTNGNLLDNLNIIWFVPFLSYATPTIFSGISSYLIKKLLDKIIPNHTKSLTLIVAIVLFLLIGFILAKCVFRTL